MHLNPIRCCVTSVLVAVILPGIAFGLTWPKKKAYRINISLLNLYHSKHTQVIMEAGRRDKRPHSFTHSVSTAGSSHSCSLLKALCWDGHQFNSPNSLILPERIFFFFEPLTFHPLSLVVAWLMWPRPPTPAGSPRSLLATVLQWPSCPCTCTLKAFLSQKIK